MKEGSLVECVDGSAPDYQNAITRSVYHRNKVKFPVKGETYIIRDILPSWSEDGSTCVRLQEIINPSIKYGDGTTQEPAFRISRFRELQPPMDLSKLLREVKKQPDFDRARQEINDYLTKLYP